MANIELYQSKSLTPDQELVSLFNENNQANDPEAPLRTVEDMSAFVPAEMFPGAAPEIAFHAKVITDNVLEFGGNRISFAPSEVGTLNLLLLNPGKAIYSGDIIDTLHVRKAAALNALRNIVSKCNLEGHPPLILQRKQRFGSGLRSLFNINEVILHDERVEKGDNRRQILGSLCREYGDDPRVLAKLKSFVPANLLTVDLPSYRLYRLQKKGIPRISEDEEVTLIRQLDEVVTNIQEQRETEEECIQATVAAKKLCFTLLGLADYIANKHIAKSHANLLRNWNDLRSSTDDLLQAANITLIEAVYTFDSTKGAALASWVGLLIDHSLGRVRSKERLHAEGLTKAELEAHIGALITHSKSGSKAAPPMLAPRRVPIDDMRNIATDYVLDKSSYTDHINELLGTLSASQTVAIIFNSPALRPIEKFVLGMTFGIYDPKFAGTTFGIKDKGRAFTYSTSLRDNVLFREGITPHDFGRYFGITPEASRELQASAIDKARDVIISATAEAEDSQKWADWTW